jgi:hypothetical protein
MHRATSVYEPIPLNDFSSRHRHFAVHGGGEAHFLSASDVYWDRRDGDSGGPSSRFTLVGVPRNRHR